MIDNRELLQKLILEGQIALNQANIFQINPDPLPTGWDFNRVEGMLIGLAIGDSLGNTSEAMNPPDRQNIHGEIKDYLPNEHAGMRAVGTPSDDTQMAFWTLERLLADGGLDPDHLAAEFTHHNIYQIGSAVKAFIHAYKDRGMPWTQSGQPSAGNGAVMRIAPVLIPHLKNPSPALWADAALAGMITHNDRASNACCIAFTDLLWDCLCMHQVPGPSWWVDKYVSIAGPLEGNATYSSRHSGLDYEGPLWQLIDREVRAAIHENLSTLVACERWHSGAYLLETMPCALYILAKHAGDPEEAIVRAVNDTRDNDTVAAVVGAAVGALHGKAGLPERWIDGLTGRTRENDDGHIFDLVEQARQVFWQKG